MLSTEEIEQYIQENELSNLNNKEIVEEAIASLINSMNYRENGFRRVEKVALVAIHILQNNTKQLETINDKYLQKLVYALTPTTHELSTDNNNAFKQIIADNIDLETCKIRRKLKEFWGIDKY